MKLIRLPDVKAKTSLGKTSIYKLIQEKKFPAPVKQGGGSFWFEHDIDAYLLSLRPANPTSPPTAASS